MKTDRVSPGWYRWYVLGLLTLISAFSFMDRQLPFVLGESIKRDLGLSDGQLGLIGGLAFSLFYAVFSLPVARLADRTSRRWVLSGALGLWSVMTTLSGFAQGFAPLFISRVGVAIGESGGMAPSHSIIAGYFESGTRATAMALFLVGSTAGVMLGFSLGGWIDATLGWRFAFFLFGAPGLVLALLAGLTLRDPAHTEADAVKPAQFIAVLTRLARIGTYRDLALAASFHAIASASVIAWLAPLLMRAHGINSGQAGLIVGLLTGVAGSVSIAGAGYLSDRLARGDRRWQMRVPAIGVLVGLPLYAVGILVPSLSLAVLLLAAACLVCMSFAGPIFATVQDLSPPADRSVASAVVVLLTGLIGGALGPPVAGFLSDRFAPTMGPDSLRAALVAIIVAGHLGAALLFWRAATRLPGDLAKAGTRSAGLA